MVVSIRHQCQTWPLAQPDPIEPDVAFDIVIRQMIDMTTDHDVANFRIRLQWPQLKRNPFGVRASNRPCFESLNSLSAGIQK